MKYFVLLAVVTVFLSSVLAGDSLWRTRRGYNPDVALNRRQLSARCSSALSALPAECREYFNADITDSAPCNETCGRPIYDAHQVCDDLSDTTDIAAIFDLQCARNKDGKTCADVFNDIDIDCDELSPDFCPALCAQELKESDIESDCCLYTLFVISLNVSFTNGALDACGIDHAGSCIGAFSGEPIVLSEGPPTVSAKPPTMSGELSTIAVSYLILMASLLVVMIL